MTDSETNKLQDGEEDGTEARRGQSTKFAAVIDSAANFVGSVRTLPQFAIAGMLFVLAVSIAALYRFHEEVEPQYVLYALGLSLGVLIVLAWLWSRRLAVDTAADLTDASKTVNSEAASEALETQETIFVGDRTEVIKAFDPALRRHVVKKVLTTGEARDEFINGARTSMQLANLPNYMKIYSADFRPGEAPYLVMQYLKGGSLNSLIERHGANLLPLDDVRRIVHRVGVAIDKAHQRSVPLGNLKPSNILLDEEGEPHLSPRVRLTFMKPAEIKEAVRERKVTLEDLAYAAPELFASGDADAVVHDLTDQYALGILAYHLATGSLPRTLPTMDSLPESARVERSCALLLEQGAAAFQELPDLAELRARIPKQVSDTFRRMVSLNRFDRFSRLDLALRAMHSAEQTILLAARDSYTRCLSTEREQTFFERFYSEFTSNEQIAARFVNFDEESWTAQHGKLQHAIEASFNFVKDFVATVDFEEPNALSIYAESHACLGIEPSEYQIFADALVRSVCGTADHPPYDPECEDPQRRSDIERSWRELMNPVVRYFTAKSQTVARQR